MFNLFRSYLNYLSPTSLKSAVGLDISAAAIKLVELKPLNIDYQLLHCAIEPLTNGIVSENEIKHRDNLCNAVERCFLTSGSTNTKIVIAIPNTRVMSKIIQLSAGLSEQEIYTQLSLEFDRYFSQPIESLNFDFQLMHPSEDKEDEIDVLLIACHKKYLEAQVSLLENAGLSVQGVDVTSYAIKRAFQKLYYYADYREVFAVIDIETNYLTIIIQQSNQTLSSHYESIEIQTTVETLCSQIQRYFQFFLSSYPHYSIKELFIIGNSEYLNDMSNYLNKLFSIKTRCMHSIPRLLIADTQKSLPISRLWLSCGLALWHADSSS